MNQSNAVTRTLLDKHRSAARCLPRGHQDHHLAQYLRYFLPLAHITPFRRIYMSQTTRRVWKGAENDTRYMESTCPQGRAPDESRPDKDAGRRSARDYRKRRRWLDLVQALCGQGELGPAELPGSRR